MTIRLVEVFLVCANLAGIILGRSVIITDATGYAAVLSGTIQFTMGSFGSLRCTAARSAVGWLG